MTQTLTSIGHRTAFKVCILKLVINLIDLRYITYLKLVGYNSDVYRNTVLNDPVMANLPSNAKTVPNTGSHSFSPESKDVKSEHKHYRTKSLRT